MHDLVILEDHVGVAEAIGFGLCSALPLRLVATYDRVQPAIDGLRGTHPALVIFDWRMPHGEGAELPKRLARNMPHTRWLLYTAHPNTWVVRTAIECGAHGSVSKGQTFGVLVDACRALLAGQSYFCGESSEAIRKIASNQAAIDGLNKTERKILLHVAAGYNAHEIAGLSGIETKTVHNNLSNIRAKLGLSGVVDLAKYAIEHGLAPL